MKIRMVAVHYPKDEHRLTFVRPVNAAAAVGATRGCLAAECWVTADGAVVSIAQWADEIAMRESVTAAESAGVEFTFDDRQARPRDSCASSRPWSDARPRHETGSE